jgi:hypothetical protein
MIHGDRRLVEYGRRREVQNVAAVQETRQGLP